MIIYSHMVNIVKFTFLKNGWFFKLNNFELNVELKVKKNTFL